MQFLLLAAADPAVAELGLPGDFYLVVGMMGALSCLQVLVRSHGATVAMTLTKFLLAVLVGIPLGAHLWLEAVLFSLIVLEVQYYLESPASHAVAGAVIVAATLLQRPYFVRNWEIPRPPATDLMGFVLVMTSVAAVGALVRRVVDRNEVLEESNGYLNAAVGRLMEANRGFQEYALSAKEDAERDERKRISREIHDTAGYTLTNLIVMMESATDFSKTDPEKTELLLEQARRVAESGLEDIRYCLRTLRSLGSEPLHGIKAVHRLIDTFSQITGIKVNIEYGNLPWSLGSEIDDVLYHIVQEGITNAFRHGQAMRIDILLWLTETNLLIRIADNGSGAKSIKEGIGFQGIQEMLSRLGGKFNAGNSEGGFQISASIPIGRSKVTEP
ncbi:MAG: sensor histidine kinase [Spirochaetales bacterium]|nr:sensor histidine kinase [Spirochaetales bacterium]